jgi:hypothetical protein
MTPMLGFSYSAEGLAEEKPSMLLADGLMLGSSSQQQFRDDGQCIVGCFMKTLNQVMRWVWNCYYEFGSSIIDNFHKPVTIANGPPLWFCKLWDPITFLFVSLRAKSLVYSCSARREESIGIGFIPVCDGDRNWEIAQSLWESKKQNAN